jgi:hypothetical protein
MPLNASVLSLQTRQLGAQRGRLSRAIKSILSEPRLSESLAGRARFVDLWPLSQGAARSVRAPVWWRVSGGGARRVKPSSAGLLRLVRQNAQPTRHRRTESDDATLVEAIFLTWRLPAWAPSITSKAKRRPKLHLVDTGLAAHLLGVSVDTFTRVGHPSDGRLCQPIHEYG